MKTKEQIKLDIEGYLLKGFVFEYILKSNPKVYENELSLLFTEEEIIQDDYIQFVNFDYDPEEITFEENPIVHKFYENEIEIENLQSAAIFISDFEFTGSIYKTSLTPIKLKIEATLIIFIRTVSPPPIDGFFVIPDIINLKDKTSYMIWDRKDKPNEILRLEKQFKIKLD